MTISEGMKTYHLQNPATSESLGSRFSGMDGKVLAFGDKVLVAGYFHNRIKKPRYFAAVYTF